MSSVAASYLADAVMYIHFGIVFFCISGFAAIILGIFLDWRWSRNRPFRLIHLGLLIFVAAQSLLGRVCSLTILESRLRQMAGEEGYERSFTSTWVSRLLYQDFPEWVFITIYIFAALLGALLLVIAPPEKKI